MQGINNSDNGDKKRTIYSIIRINNMVYPYCLDNIVDPKNVDNVFLV